MKRLILFFLTLSTLLYALEPIVPLPQQVHVDKQKALLGYRLFMDPILSKDRSTSCLSCHNIFTAGGADHRAFSVGVYGKKDNIHSPTVLNARYNFKQFWNGRAANLNAQLNGPLHNPIEMDMSNTLIERRLNADAEYKKLFFAAFHTKYITYKEVAEAIVAFEDALVTPDSKFDQFLRGKTKLSKKEMQGYQDFKELGCITCHNGINIGGNMMQKIGIFYPYTNTQAYPDLYKITHNSAYINVFKVPTLRNIALSAPYFHDGSAKTLAKAIELMGHYQLGITLSKHQISNIVAFLKTLTGKSPKILSELR
jgi:cytochrome c peroxidase